MLGISILQIPNMLLHIFGSLKEYYVRKFSPRWNKFTNNMVTEKPQTQSKCLLSPKKCNTAFEIINERPTLDRKRKNDVNKFLDEVLDVLE